MKNRTDFESSSLVDLLIQANELRRQNNYRAALTLYLTVKEQFGESAHLLALIAHCYYGLALVCRGTDQDCLESVIWIKKAIALEPDSARLYTDLGEHCLLATLDYEQAVFAYRRAIELDPHNVRALVGATSLYGLAEEVVTIREAIQWLERVVQLEPDNPNYHARLGQLYYQVSRIQDAKREWLEALLCAEPLDSGYVQVITEMLNIQDKN